MIPVVPWAISPAWGVPSSPRALARFDLWEVIQGGGIWRKKEDKKINIVVIKKEREEYLKVVD